MIKQNSLLIVGILMIAIGGYITYNAPQGTYDTSRQTVSGKGTYSPSKQVALGTILIVVGFILLLIFMIKDAI